MKTPKTILTCSECGAKSQDLNKNQRAWDGWIIAPKNVCPSCSAKVVELRIVITPDLNGKPMRAFVCQEHQGAMP